ncbi:hypothetical protein ABTW96_01070 [Nocardia beijingensis]|uniref:hypothetical protein n=1 Tax=Nocardia beijingensis TaxID=95162 RepID=UPI00331CCC67
MNGRAADGGDGPLLRTPLVEGHDVDLAPLGPVAEVLGLTMVVAVLAALSRIPAWTSDYGVMVIAAVILYLAVATGLVRWGGEHRRDRCRDT